MKIDYVKLYLLDCFRCCLLNDMNGPGTLNAGSAHVARRYDITYCKDEYEVAKLIAKFGPFIMLYTTMTETEVRFSYIPKDEMIVYASHWDLHEVMAEWDWRHAKELGKNISN